MKQLVLILILLVLTAFASQAAERISISSGTEDVSVTVLQSNGTETILQIEVNAFEREKIDIAGQQYYAISCGKEGLILNSGAPSLPHICRSIIIPDEADMVVEVLASEYKDYPGMPIAPSKGVLLRTVNPADVPYTFGTVYQNPQPYPVEIASLREPYILRDYRGTVVELNTFQYLSREQTLRVYKSVTVSIHEIGYGQTNVLHRTHPMTTVDPGFAQLYQKHFLNYGMGGAMLYTSVDEAGEILVITYDSFRTTMQPYVSWKIQKGIKTTMVNVSTIGNNSTSIKNYIQTFFNNTSGNLAYVLLVGDATQVATPTASGGSSDPTYAKVSGSDNYPDIFIGRFSAETTAQVLTQVERSVEYERDLQATATWLHFATGIASDQGPGDDNEYDYQHMNNIRTDLLGYTYTAVDQIYDPSATAAQVSAALNAGRGIVNYTGHGSNNSWSTTGFSNSNITALTNDDKLPFVYSVGCVNGQFNGITCFAETWLRSTRSGNPIGALATYMSSIDQSWNSPMDAQDEYIDLLRTNAKSSFGGLCYNSSCHMMDVYGSDGVNMYNTWHVFGDPSVQVRTNTPAVMSVSHTGSINSSATTYNVTVTGVTGALCALARNDTIYGTAYTNSSGLAVISIIGTLPAGQNLTLTVTAFNKVTNISTVTVFSGPITITETAPNGGETWYIGESNNITWTSTNLNENVKIEINRSYPSSTWETIAASVSNSGSYAWPVTAAETSTARIRITGTVNTTKGDTSDANFTIAARTITVTSPNGGESWRAGDSHTITWTSLNITGNVKIELDRSYPYGIWETINANTGNTGSLTWLLTEPASFSASIRITSLNYPLISDESNASFEIRNYNQPPVMTHDPLHDQITANFPVTAIVTDDAIGLVTRFFYKPTSSSIYDSLLMTTSGNPNEYSVSVNPAVSGSYDYYLVARDADGLTVSTLPFTFLYAPAYVFGTLQAYDDGVAERSNWSSSNNYQWAVKFSVTSAPYALYLAQIGISSVHPDTVHSPIQVQVILADGSGGMPGTVLQTRIAGSIGNVIGGLTYPPANWDNVLFRDDSGNPLQLSGDFYIAVSNPDSTKNESFLQDTSSTYAGRSYVYNPCDQQWFAESSGDTCARLGNRMIRVTGFSLVAPNAVIQRSGSDVRLDWNRTGAPQYRIYSATQSAGPFETVEGTTADTTFIDTGAISSGNMLYYQVKAIAP